MGFGGTVVHALRPKICGPRYRWYEGTAQHAHGRQGEGDMCWGNREGDTPEVMDERLMAQGYVLCDDLVSFHTALAKWYEEHPRNMPAKAPTLTQDPRQGLDRHTTAQNGIDATTGRVEPKESE